MTGVRGIHFLLALYDATIAQAHSSKLIRPCWIDGYKCVDSDPGFPRLFGLETNWQRPLVVFWCDLPFRRFNPHMSHFNVLAQRDVCDVDENAGSARVSIACRKLGEVRADAHRGRHTKNAPQPVEYGTDD